MNKNDYEYECWPTARMPKCRCVAYNMLPNVPESLKKSPSVAMQGLLSARWFETLCAPFTISLPTPRKRYKQMHIFITQIRPIGNCICCISVDFCFSRCAAIKVVVANVPKYFRLCAQIHPNSPHTHANHSQSLCQKS